MKMSGDPINIKKKFYRKAVEYLDKARMVRVFGMSPNCYLGDLFCRKLATIGKQASVAMPSESSTSTLRSSAMPPG